MTPPFRLNTARRPNAGVAEELCPLGVGCIRSYKNVKCVKESLRIAVHAETVKIGMNNWAKLRFDFTSVFI